MFRHFLNPLVIDTRGTQGICKNLKKKKLAALALLKPQPGQLGHNFMKEILFLQIKIII